MNTTTTTRVSPALSHASIRTDTKPWYRQFWPWFLIALPAISVVFSFATLYIAVTHADEVVPHDENEGGYAAPPPAATPAAPVAAPRPEAAAPDASRTKP